MISAFEMQTGLAQDMRSPTKSLPTKHRSRTVEIKASSKDLNSMGRNECNTETLNGALMLSNIYSSQYNILEE
ncbi:hypothetical protein K1719_016548 [Acacia pycnantha]|nr:hypothetical protein K1719_016548 [Acacia pycnantha]